MSNKIYIYLVILGMSIAINSHNLKAQSPNNSNSPTCKVPVLSKLKNHVIKSTDTLQSIANQYNLLTETLLNLNPILTKQPIPVGKTIKIPPFNGIKIEVKSGISWKELAKAYGVRQDVLFELNGCQKIPKTVFIPGINWSKKAVNSINYIGFTGYPLESQAKIGLNYGWQTLPNSEQKIFHSGIDLLADVNSNVLSVEDGEVIYIGNEANYGFFIIINHSGNRQTRYAHLSKINVKMNTQVKVGEVIGNVGTTGIPDIVNPHLHFEVRYQTSQGWIAQNPILHLKKNN